MTKKDEHGNPIFDKTIILEIRIDLRLIYDRDPPYWEVMFHGKVPGVLMGSHKLAEKVVELWMLSKDPKGTKAAELHKELVLRAHEGQSIKEMMQFCESLV